MSWPPPPPPPGYWGRVPVVPKPGVIPLKPLSVGDVLGGVALTLRRYFWPVYAPLLALGAVAVLGLAVLVAAGYHDAHHLYELARAHVDDRGWQPARHDFVTLLGLGGAGAGFFGLMLLLVTMTGTLTGTAVLRHATVGRRVTARQLLRESLGAFWRLLGAMLLLGLGMLLWYVLGLALVVGLALATHNPGLPMLALLLWLLTGVGVVYVYVRLALLYPVIVLEGSGPVAAFARAWRLNEGAWWRSLGIPLLTGLISGLVVQLVLSPLSVVAGALTGTDAPTAPSDPTDVNLSAFLLSTLVSTLLTIPVWMLLQLLVQPISPLTKGLLYIDRRIRRESLDVHLAAEAGIHLVHTAPWPGGYAPPAPPAPGPYPAAAPGIPPQAPPPASDAPVDLDKRTPGEED